MKQRWPVYALFLVFFMGCGSDEDGKIGEPCFRDSECDSHLSCIDNTCADPDSITDGDTDASDSDTSATDGDTDNTQAARTTAECQKLCDHIADCYENPEHGKTFAAVRADCHRLCETVDVFAGRPDCIETAACETFSEDCPEFYFHLNELGEQCVSACEKRGFCDAPENGGPGDMRKYYTEDCTRQCWFPGDSDGACFACVIDMECHRLDRVCWNCMDEPWPELISDCQAACEQVATCDMSADGKHMLDDPWLADCRDRCRYKAHFGVSEIACIVETSCADMNEECPGVEDRVAHFYDSMDHSSYPFNGPYGYTEAELRRLCTDACAKQRYCDSSERGGSGRRNHDWQTACQAECLTTTQLPEIVSRCLMDTPCNKIDECGELPEPTLSDDR